MTFLATIQAFVERLADTLGRLETCWRKRMAYSIIDHPIGGEGADLACSSQSEPCSRSRREFLATLAVLGISAVVSAQTLIPQTAAPSAKLGLIDLHHHILPPFYL